MSDDDSYEALADAERAEWLADRNLAAAWDEGHRDACDDHLCEQMGHLDRNPYRSAAHQ